MSDSPPDILIDHCLGTRAIPEVFRDAGFTVATMVERYGRADVMDIEWIEDAGKAGMLVITKDDRIRRRPAEKKAVTDHGLRMVCLASQNMASDEMAELFKRHMNKIRLRMGRRGPWIAVLNRSGLREIRLT
jgi:predicted nuclease of predicted toxin-antitoxin system